MNRVWAWTRMDWTPLDPGIWVSCLEGSLCSSFHQAHPYGEGFCSAKKDVSNWSHVPGSQYPRPPTSWIPQQYLVLYKVLPEIQPGLLGFHPRDENWRESWLEIKLLAWVVHKLETILSPQCGIKWGVGGEADGHQARALSKSWPLVLKTGRRDSLMIHALWEVNLRLEMVRFQA